MAEFSQYYYMNSAIPLFLIKLEKPYIPPPWARLPFEITDDLTFSSIVRN